MSRPDIIAHSPALTSRPCAYGLACNPADLVTHRYFSIRPEPRTLANYVICTLSPGHSPRHRRLSDPGTAILCHRRCLKAEVRPLIPLLRHLSRHDPRILTRVRRLSRACMCFARFLLHAHMIDRNIYITGFTIDAIKLVARKTHGRGNASCPNS